MADVSIKYKGSTIAEMSGTGTKTLKTAGTYCEGDIEVNYAPNFRKWEVTITSSLPSSGVVHYLVTDTWLAQNRSNPNLCVVVMPQFTIEGDGNIQGVFLGTNKPLIKIGNNTHYSLSAYKYSGGSVAARMRLNKLTGANDIGDLNITHEGLLYAYAYSPYGFAVGTYAVIAFIV